MLELHGNQQPSPLMCPELAGDPAILLSKTDTSSKRSSSQDEKKTNKQTKIKKTLNLENKVSGIIKRHSSVAAVIMIAWHPIYLTSQSAWEDNLLWIFWLYLSNEN